MYQYAEILSQGESLNDIKNEAEDSKKPKSLDEDGAMAVFIDQVNQASGNDEDPTATPDPVKPKPKEEKVVKEKPKQIGESEEVKENTKAWANAQIVTE